MSNATLIGVREHNPGRFSLVVFVTPDRYSDWGVVDSAKSVVDVLHFAVNQRPEWINLPANFRSHDGVWVDLDTRKLLALRKR